MSEFQKDFDKATNFFLINKDIIQSSLNGKIYSIELDNSELAKILDTNTGIDYVLVNNEKKVYGISARVNQSKYTHNTITIRVSRKKYNFDKFYGVEFQKGVSAYKDLTSSIIASKGLQMDANDNELLKIIYYDRKALFLYAYDNYNDIKEKHLKTVKADGNMYLKFNYKDLSLFGIEHIIKEFN